MLASLLRERIRRAGPLSFHDVMAAALYDPEYGYYTRLTSLDDFWTSPEVHPAFGWLLGRQVLDVWDTLDRPRPLHVLELGAGSGSLAEALVLCLREYVPEITYTIDEPSPALRATQQRRLTDAAFEWDARQTQAHFVIANEVADALPVHRIVVRDGALHELRVGLSANEQLTWIESSTAPPEVQAYFERLNLLPPDGAITEVSTGLWAWAHQLAARLSRGVALILDYGYPAETLFQRRHGSLLTYFRHTLGSDPLVRLGEQDISVHVDFSTLALAAREAGLRVMGVASQSTLLRNLGLPELSQHAHTQADRERLGDLLDTNGLGQIGTLFLERGMPTYVPAGLIGARTWPPSQAVPWLRHDDDDDFMAQWREAFPGKRENIEHAY